jgi:hypothetical protein
VIVGLRTPVAPVFDSTGTICTYTFPQIPVGQNASVGVSVPGSASSTTWTATVAGVNIGTFGGTSTLSPVFLSGPEQLVVTGIVLAGTNPGAAVMGGQQGPPDEVGAPPTGPVAGQSAAEPGSGIVQLVNVPNPAAGADWSYMLTGAARFVALFALLTLSASPGTRYPFLATSGSVLAVPMTGVALTAGEDLAFEGYTAGPQLPEAAAGTLTGRTLWLFGFPDALYPAGTVLESITNGLLSGDQWSVVTLAFS